LFKDYKNLCFDESTGENSSPVCARFYRINILGSVIVTAGTYVTSKRMKMRTGINVKIALTVLSREHFAIAQPTNKAVPTGG
jgi:hypothetical protein